MTTIDHPSIEQLPEVSAALEHLTISAEPAVVFSSLAELSIRVFSHGCTVDIVEQERAAYRISYPHTKAHTSAPESPTGPVGSRMIRTTIHTPVVTGYPHYAGAMVHTWRTHHPGPADFAIARLLVDCAVAVVAQERLADRVQRTQGKAAKGQAALGSNRRIGMAMGILAATQAIDAQAAFAMLREESQRTKTTLRDVTERVIATASGSSAWTGGDGNATRSSNDSHWLSY